MNEKNLIKCLVSWFADNSSMGMLRKANSVHVVPLLESLSPQQLFQLQHGSGNPIAEMYQVNSSAGLAVNYYKLFEKTHSGVTVEFEWKASVPLLRSTAPANLDVRYEMDDTIYFIESKFLEPYYSPLKKNRPAYFDTERYPFDENKAEWKALLEHECEFSYYDYPQLCRHLLAIYRHCRENPSLYQGKKIVMRCISWRMSQSFKDFYDKCGLVVQDMQTRCDKIEEEKSKAVTLFNEHLQCIGWTDCRFETKNYNDSEMLDEIREAKKFNQFIKQYFLES